jgi:hypothetical protein
MNHIIIIDRLIIDKREMFTQCLRVWKFYFDELRAGFSVFTLDERRFLKAFPNVRECDDKMREISID